MLTAARRDRVNASFVPGVAARYPAQAQPEALEWAMHLYRFNHVAGAAWIKAATGWYEWADEILVKLHQQNKKTADQAFNPAHRLSVLGSVVLATVMVTLSGGAEK